MIDPKCTHCAQKPCREGNYDEARLPNFCPIKNYKTIINEVTERYHSPEIHDFFLKAAYLEKECYQEKASREENKIFPLRPRIRELTEFAKKLQAKKIGVAFCLGLADEADRAVSIFESHGLDVCSVICSCGAIDKTEVNIPPEGKIRNPDKFEASCNPLLQAELLNRSKTAFNVIIGLCVGHDMLFTKFSEAPVTTLIVKDRFTGHNPVITLYSRYHKDIV